MAICNGQNPEELIIQIPCVVTFLTAWKINKYGIFQQIFTNADKILGTDQDQIGSSSDSKCCCDSCLLDSQTWQMLSCLKVSCHGEMGKLFGVSCRQSHPHRRRYLWSLDKHTWKGQCMASRTTPYFSSVDLHTNKDIYGHNFRNLSASSELFLAPAILEFS